MTSNTLAMIQAYLDGGSGSTMEQIIMKQAYGDIVRLTAERDEARREVCRNEANHLPTMADPHREAARRGWDCFKKEERNAALDRIAQFDQENGLL
jgi:hypothetical protein